MAALPYQGDLNVPISWSVQPIKTTFTAGSYSLSGTIGFKPWKSTATLSWTLPKDKAKALLAELEAGMFNRVYDYTCSLRGAVRIRPTDSAGFQERRGTQFVTITCAFERV
ncbi:hypothetical protein [Sphingomonas sp. Leaf28]|uniref:hypothetical protein n=1 Tax=Sphingomonas sp. Leaf28 TaxID=1735695 RepID=UPI000701706D|nr:hypothetical protein [Sphingomonas sp. Leaf28]KQN09070.1 hypothetical protein ASE79_14555 [Sphingomonas sp. Leaf28]